MTDERDFDRLAQAWLELGPDEAPDRVVAAVLQAAETTPQVRRPIRRPTWRFVPMNMRPLAAMAAVVVIAIGGGILLLQPGQGTGTSPGTESPSPTATVSASPTAAVTTTVPVPATLQAMWVGPKRTIPGFPSNLRYRFTLTASGLAFPDDAMQKSVLVSDATAPAAGQLQLTTTDSTVGCQPGNVGRYTWSLSPSGGRLTLVATSDACQARSAALAGDWIRVACKDTTDGCLGDLRDAGTYSSQYVTPMLATSAAWQPTWGALTYTVPAGWANSTDWPNTFSLTPSTDYAKETSQGPPAGVHNEIDVYRRPGPVVQDATCNKILLATVPRTVDGLIGYVRGLKSVVATAPAPITISGHQGKWIDVKVAPTWTATCPGDPIAAPSVVAIGYDGTQSGLNDYTLGILGPERLRMIFLDLGAGDVVLIVVDSTNAARFDQLIGTAMPIIASFNFK